MTFPKISKTQITPKKHKTHFKKSKINVRTPKIRQVQKTNNSQNLKILIITF